VHQDIGPIDYSAVRRLRFRNIQVPRHMLAIGTLGHMGGGNRCGRDTCRAVDLEVCCGNPNETATSSQRIRRYTSVMVR
jgi:hypothetical protein